MSTSNGGVKLTLGPRPGRGSFDQTGSRGGYGFAVGETYEDGHACGMLCSPWHDGEEYRQPKDWMMWVLENVSEIVSSSHVKPKPAKKSKRKKRR